MPDKQHQSDEQISFAKGKFVSL